MLTVLLFYKYIHIEDSVKEVQWMRVICDRLALKGRIIIAPEGINATVAGSDERIREYKAELEKSTLFSGIIYKESEAEEDVFPRLSIKARKELVSLKLKEDIDLNDPEVSKGGYIEPEDLKKLLDSDEEYYIVDVRNSYETFIGKFKDSITFDIANFRDFPKALKQIEHLKNKRVIPVCTGGIRCEKASAYMVQQGFTNVTQLHGGIVTYGNAYPDDGFEGKCYVFDSRIALMINSKGKEKIIGTCYHCKKPCDRYINCCNASCNLHFVCCEECATIHEEACSDTCKQHSRYTIDHARKNP